MPIHTSQNDNPPIDIPEPVPAILNQFQRPVRQFGYPNLQEANLGNRRLGRRRPG